MTAERAKAYGRVAAVLANVAPSKLQPLELATIRFAADELVLAPDPLAEPAADALRDAYDVLDHLVQCGRWTRDGAGRLGQHLEDCAGANVAVPA
jgi:hypothetical protein